MGIHANNSGRAKGSKIQTSRCSDETALWGCGNGIGTWGVAICIHLLGCVANCCCNGSCCSWHHRSCRCRCYRCNWFLFFCLADDCMWMQTLLFFVVVEVRILIGDYVQLHVCVHKMENYRFHVCTLKQMQLYTSLHCSVRYVGSSTYYVLCFARRISLLLVKGRLNSNEYVCVCLHVLPAANVCLMYWKFKLKLGKHFLEKCTLCAGGTNQYATVCDAVVVE